MYVCMYVCITIHTYIHTYMYIYIYIIYIYMYACGNGEEELLIKEEDNGRDVVDAALCIILPRLARRPHHCVCCVCMHVNRTSAYVSIRQHAPAYVSIRNRPAAVASRVVRKGATISTTFSLPRAFHTPSVCNKQAEDRVCQQVCIRCSGGLISLIMRTTSSTHTHTHTHTHTQTHTHTHT